MKNYHLIKNLPALCILIFSTQITLAQSPCGNDDVQADAQITGGTSRTHRHCSSTAGTGNFACAFGTILSPNCGDAPLFGIDWFSNAIGILSGLNSNCGEVYYSEVLKQITIIGENASPNCTYDLKIDWARDASTYSPAGNWTETIRLTANSQGTLSHVIEVPVQVHSQGDLVAAEHRIENATFELVECLDFTNVSVDASNPNQTKVNFDVIPFESTPIDVDFIIGSETVATKSNFTGRSFFTFNQDDLPSGSTTIKLAFRQNGNPCGVAYEITAMRSIQSPQAFELVEAVFLTEGIGLRVFAHTYANSPHHRFTYSASYSGKTIKPLSSRVRMNFNALPEATWTERHQYRTSSGNTPWINAGACVPPTGFMNPGDRERCVSGEHWLDGTNAKGIFDTQNLVYIDPQSGLATPALTIVNSEVDVSF